MERPALPARGSGLAGVASVAAYGLVLVALTRAPVNAVAAVRESSVLIAVVLAARLEHRRLGRRELLAAGTITAGLVAFAVG